MGRGIRRGQPTHLEVDIYIGQGVQEGVKLLPEQQEAGNDSVLFRVITGASREEA
jgi:hypothetical protein